MLRVVISNSCSKRLAKLSDLAPGSPTFGTALRKARLELVEAHYPAGRQISQAFVDCLYFVFGIVKSVAQHITQDVADTAIRLARQTGQTLALAFLQIDRLSPRCLR